MRFKKVKKGVEVSVDSRRIYRYKGRFSLFVPADKMPSYKYIKQVTFRNTLRKVESKRLFRKLERELK